MFLFRCIRRVVEVYITLLFCHDVMQRTLWAFINVLNNNTFLNVQHQFAAYERSARAHGGNRWSFSAIYTWTELVTWPCTSGLKHQCQKVFTWHLSDIPPHGYVWNNEQRTNLIRGKMVLRNASGQENAAMTMQRGLSLASILPDNGSSSIAATVGDTSCCNEEIIFVMSLT